MTTTNPAASSRNLRALSALTDRLDDFRTDLPVEPRLARRDPARLGRLFGLRAAEELIADHGLRHPLFTMSKDGSRLPGSAYTYAQRTPGSVTRDMPDPSAVQARFADRATLILEHLHRTWRPVADFCRRLGYEIGRPVGANAYLTPENAQGFGIHYDTHGAFVIQLAGRKTWELNRPIAPFPLDDQRWRESMLTAEDRKTLRDSGPFARYELTVGDVLWLPRGWLHEVFTTDAAPSLHLTLSVPEVSPHWLAARAFEGLAQEEDFRRELPLAALASEEGAREESARMLKELSAWASRQDAAAIAERAVAALRTFWNPPRPSPVTAAILSDADLDSAAGIVTIREAVLAVDYRADGALVLHIGDREVAVEPSAAEFVAARLEADDPATMPIGTYLDGLGTRGHQVLRQLLGAGVVEVVWDDDAGRAMVY
ncbi:lysine-specific demethylase/histidyl-hydroxylase NO66 [Catenulispora sp. MAP5-51]|uniref:JmjC domain-containing protein n=1 Tax=Catenulispora sp. MAP5-51 TaxID=3156298 RepID=UPI0035144D7A